MALNASATQTFVPIKEIRDGITVLKDGGVRAVLLASSINLALKSYDEQRATLAQFQTFLNSLDFSVQIVVQSRKYDIRPYLLSLEERAKAQLEPLLKVQTREYIDFIKGLTEQINIMQKHFFVVIPYTPAITQGARNAALSFIGKRSKAEQDVDAATAFEESRSQLEQRINIVEQGLSRIGVRTTQLGTEEVVELFYKTFNPGDISKGMKFEG